MSVLELAAAKAHLNLSAEATTHDDELQAFIDAAEGAIARLVGPLTATEFTERVRGSRTTLAITKLPLIDVVSLTPINGTAVALDTLVVDAAGTIELASGVGSFASGVYTVVYTAGYVELPANLELAVKELVRHLWATQRGPTGRPGKAGTEALANSLPGAAYALPIRVEQLLSPFVPLGSA